ncbi:cysteine desulfurase family protein [Desulfosarcina sp.]|uniref:cysteine desulfurase family protein n=1 Tax=Desulfosarcina sp. TaxID=2027861 RepID=UPI0029B3F15C|nr:cysteine desulfurase family protein [Desulfosarcina sp.]MDX2452113.1 cysteine desulfurase family protein [Desulfosarcina sp.]MDX2489906.1 cysteine desulfurase family protein [Desulfosarcina sp.]
MVQPVYLDYNGTTPHDPEVITAMQPFLETEFGNPSSSHWYGIRPKRAVETARRQVAGLLGCQPDEVFFTSGGTESNNHAIKGMARALREKGRHLITSTVEHPAVLDVCRYLVQEGFETTFVDADETGMIRVDDVAAAIRPDTILISVMHANNEVGTIQPISKIAGIARQQGICIHTDAAQSLGKIVVDVQSMNVDMLSVAGHKLYAPKGVGALYVRKGLLPEKFCHGAGQEMGWRAGTENVMAVVGLGKACEMAERSLDYAGRHLKAMRDRLHTGLADGLADMNLNGHHEYRLPNTLSLSFKGLEANRILEEIGLDVAASAGAACHSDTVTLSHVLEAMRVPVEWAKGTVRFSTGRMTTADQIDRAVTVVVSAVRRLRGLTAVR